MTLQPVQYQPPVREPMTRGRLERELGEMGLSALQTAWALAAADEYRANGIDAHARSPRSQGGQKDAA